MANSQVSPGDIITAAKINEFTRGDTPPSTSGLPAGAVWVDTSNPSVPVVKYWTGSSWQAVSSSAGLRYQYLATLGPVTVYQYQAPGTLASTSFTATSPTAYRIYVVGSIRQTVTMSTQTWWRMGIRLNVSQAIVDFTVNDTQPGTYTFAAEYGPVPSSGSSTHRFPSVFTGHFFQDSTAAGTVIPVGVLSCSVQWSTTNWTSLDVYVYDTAPNIQATFEIGPIHVYRLAY